MFIFLLLSFDFVVLLFGRGLLGEFEQALVRCVILAIGALQSQVLMVDILFSRIHSGAHTIPDRVYHGRWIAHNTLLKSTASDRLQMMMILVVTRRLHIGVVFVNSMVHN